MMLHTCSSCHLQALLIKLLLFNLKLHHKKSPNVGAFRFVNGTNYSVSPAVQLSSFVIYQIPG